MRHSSEDSGNPSASSTGMRCQATWKIQLARAQRARHLRGQARGSLVSPFIVQIN